MSRKIDWTPIDPILTKIYQDRDYGAVKKLSEQTGIAHSTLTQHAKRCLMVNGMNVRGLRFEKYLPTEDTLLIQNYPAPIWRLQAILASRGYQRTTKSIVNHLYNLRQSDQLPAEMDAIEDANLIGTLEVAEVMGVTLRKVQNWINRQLLKTADPDLPDDQGRIHRHLIHRRDLTEFLRTYPGHWDSRHCDHFWLVDILSATSLSAPLLINRQHTTGKGNADLMDRQVYA